MATSALTFKKLLGNFELNRPTINSIVIFNKMKYVFAKFGYFRAPFCSCSKVTLKLPILVTLGCQKLPKLVALGTAIAFKNCQKQKLFYARICLGSPIVSEIGLVSYLLHGNII